jgi:hypothetical protein
MRIRLPAKVRDWIEQEAGANYRSMNMQIAIVLAAAMEKQTQTAERRNKRLAPSSKTNTRSPT